MMIVQGKNKLVLKNGIIAIKFDEKLFFSIFLGFTSGWDYKHCNKYFSQKIVNLSSTNKIHLKCDVIDGSVLNEVRQPVLDSFVLVSSLVIRYFASLKKIIMRK